LNNDIERLCLNFLWLNDIVWREMNIDLRQKGPAVELIEIKNSMVRALPAKS